MREINHFTGSYGFLSNFSASRVTYEGEAYPTVEHAYQAAKAEYAATTRRWVKGKTVERRWREVIAALPSPQMAKALGRQIPLRPDWDTVRVEVMRTLLWEKFSPGRRHLQWLLDTGNATLVEGNTWGDTFWGVCNGVGANMLGQILMDVRMLRRQEMTTCDTSRETDPPTVRREAAADRGRGAHPAQDGPDQDPLEGHAPVDS